MSGVPLWSSVLGTRCHSMLAQVVEVEAALESVEFLGYRVVSQAEVSQREEVAS